MSEKKKFELQDFTPGKSSPSMPVTGKTFKLRDFNNPEADINDGDTPGTEVTSESVEPPPVSNPPVTESSEDLHAKGFAEAKEHYEPLLQEIEAKNALTNILQAKLEAITPVGDLQEQIFRLSTKLISAIGQKMYLVWPIDFEKMMMNEIAEMLKKYCKSGTIIVTVHPSRTESCRDILKIASLPPRMSENIRIEGEETMEKNNCKVEWQDSRLEYNQEQIMLEAERILEHLKMTY